ncbi:MAG: hypothetical protein KC493_10125 [Bacteriovoracaceae bacterium]|nr:hypothetical protein [Bacteriovoracaceae bacterium]
MKKSLFVLLIIAGVGVWFYSNSKPKDNTHDSLVDHDHGHSHKQIQNVTPISPPKISGEAKTPIKYEKPKKIKEKPSNEENSLSSLAEVLTIFGNSPIGYEPLVDQLRDWDLEPVVAKDTNQYTGTMAVIRTKSTLPGTRYFHAQYFSDENGENHLQHMSFEFRPGDGAFQKAKDYVVKKFKLKSKPAMDKPDFASWNIPNGYLVWVKVMGPEDLKDDPFNAYTIKDKGTIRVAMELEIHDGPSSHDADAHKD